MYIVRTKEIEPIVRNEQKEYFDMIPHSKKIDEKLRTRFPFECFEKKKLEVYEIGTAEECKNFINNEIDEKIRELFIYEEYAES